MGTAVAATVVVGEATVPAIGRRVRSPRPHRSAPVALSGVLDVGRERFEELVGLALDEIPDELWRRMDNVVVTVVDRPPEPGLLGLYEGIPLTERDDGYHGVTPDKISIYRSSLLEMCADEHEIIEQVRITVIHEVAHHFGIDDDRLDELGWA